MLSFQVVLFANNIYVYLFQVLKNFLSKIKFCSTHSCPCLNKVIIFAGKEVIFLCLKDNIAVRGQISAIALTLE